MSVEIGLAPLLQALLGSVRILTVLLSGPGFSHPAMPVRVRVMASVMIAWVAAPVAAGEVGILQWNALTLVGVVGVEILIGLAVGLGTNLIFAGILQLGQFMAIQGGFGAARSIDPASGAPSVAIGTALHTFALLVFFAIGGHHELIRGLAVSFRTLPVGGGLPEPGVFYDVARLGSVIFEVALRFAAPFTIVALVQNVSVGILGRVMPQLNLLMVNLPLQAAMLLVVLALSASDMLHSMKDVLEIWPSRIFQVVLGAG